MDINDAIDSADDSTCKNLLKQVMAHYLSPAFSVLPKKETELFILKVLEELGYIDKNPSPYDLVQKLRVTRSKARNLIYDRELRALSPADLDARTIDALRTPLIQKQGDLFVLEIENPLIMDHLRSKLKSLGCASDGSFSPSLVKLSLQAFTALVADAIPDDKQEMVMKALRKAGAPEKSFKGILKGALMQLGKKLAQDTGESIGESVSDYIAPILDATSEKIVSIFKALWESGGSGTDR